MNELMALFIILAIIAFYIVLAIVCYTFLGPLWTIAIGVVLLVLK